MRSFFYPHSIALIGASGETGKVGNVILKNLKNFKGRVYPVNPKYSEIDGFKCYSSISSLPETVDLAIIAIPARFVAKTLEECGLNGIRNVIVISGGFREVGVEGAKLEMELIQIARKFNINLLGPNCLGMINAEIGLNATFSEITPRSGKVAFLSQSGAFILAVILWAQKNKFGFSKVVSLGNKAILSEADFLEYLAEDPATDVIMLYVEGIQDGRRFMEIAKKVAKKKPIVVMKAGKTESGARAASSHTGSLAGSYEVYKTAFEQCGVIVAESVEELFDYAFALSKNRKAGSVAIITNSGGPGVMASDAIEIHGLKLAELSNETIEALRNFLPPSANFYNPVDILGDADTDRFSKALDLVAKDQNVGTLLAILAPTAQIDFYKAVKSVNSIQKPIFCCFMGIDEKNEEILIENRIPNFFDPTRAVKSISAVERYSRFDFSEIESERFEINREEADRVFSEFVNSGARYIGVEGMKLLECYGIPTAPWGIAKNADEAERIAESIGYPVAMKIVSPDVIHKSDIGALKLDVNKGEVRSSFYEIISRVESYMPEARIDGILVQKMVKGGREVIIGMKKDLQFGNVIMFGLGGIYVEVFKDVAFRIAPISKKEAYEMIKSVKSYALLKGVRGEKMLDINTLAETIMRFSQLSTDYPISEMEINPLKVFEKGCVAVDFRMLLEVKK
ncbi:MAG: acetate--CoA ligase family protein [Archaeoglobaceae archaeon]|nr:acetate--CoA ligase family protein [Archaeoglobaceae archaeon]MDW8118062.1 acetate--CoA ligase family protein [Archaeoglobaceae archaeon]